MSVDTLTSILGWCTVINFIILLVSTITLLSMRSMVTRIHASLFGLDAKDLGRAYFQYLAQYKIAIIVLNLTPYIALKLMGY